MRFYRSATLSQASRRRLLAGGAGAAALLGSSPVLAQTTPQDAQRTVEVSDVIVTATRRQEAQLQTPVSLSVVNTDNLIEAGVTDINALADFVPGLNASDGGAPGLGNLVIRGVYTGSGASTTGIYLDDVPYGPVIGGAGNSLAFDASLFDLQQVEVVRGPQGTLFGASAMGGVVRYVTRQPSLTDFEGYGAVDVSDTRHGGVSSLTRGRVSIPVIQHRLAVSLSGFYSDASGYTDHPLRGETDVDDSEFWGGLFTAVATPTDKLTLRFNALHQEAEYDSVAAEAFDPSTGQRLLGKREDISSAPTPRALEVDLYSLVAEWDLGWATLSSATSQQTVSFENTSDLTLSFGPLADFLAPGGAPHRVGFSSGFDTDRFTQEFRLTSPSGGRFEWLLGLYYTDQSTDEFQILTPSPADIDLLDANLPTGYEETAAFGNVTYKLTPRWDATFGVRISQIETTLNSTLTGSPFLIGPGPFPSGSINDDTVTTYLFNTRYAVSDDLNLYARAASGYRSGGANLVLIVGGVPFGQPRYEPDDLWSYEIGAKGRLFGGRLTYDIGAYVIDWSDAQLLNVASGLGSFVNAQGEVKGFGLEGSISGEVADNLWVTAAFDVIDTELQSNEPILGGVKGERLPNTPEMSLSLAADYTHQIGPELFASFGGTVRYTGEYSTTYEGGGGIAPSIPNYVNDAYGQIDLRAGLTKGNIALNAYVTNLTDEDAYQTIFNLAPTAAQGIILRPRTVGVNIRVDF